MGNAVPVLEIGGTHVTAALVDPVEGTVGTSHRQALDASGSAASIVETLLEAAALLPTPAGAMWGVAIPGPFDYANGIGRFHGVAKFESLNGFYLGAALAAGLPASPAGVRFLNDADAFGLGEYAAGTMAGHARVIALTLGTGIGSAFLAYGQVVDSGPSVPPQGSVHLLSIDGAPLEDTVSRRAILAAYGRPPSVDVVDVAAAARAGEAEAAAVLRSAFHALGVALRPWVASFEASLVVVGGSMAGSWDLVEPPLASGLGGPLVVRARHEHSAGLLGAGLWALRATRTSA
ncbi:ROK family protein [Flindersiella endophytica]